MTRSQRIVLVVYCLLAVYCCVWIPWHGSSVVTEEVVAGFNEQRVEDVRLGYDWVWSRRGPPIKYDNTDTRQARDSNLILTQRRLSARPDMVIIALSLLAAAALGGTAFLLAGKWRSP